MNCHRRAFTLVELLTVIAIVGVLAALIFAGVGAARQSAQRAGGVSSLRQIGAAIELYAQEHDARLPGPLWPGQVPLYNPDRPENEFDGRLTMFLAPYFDVPTDATPPIRVEIMIPPAFPYDELGSQPRTYVANTEAENPNASDVVNPWGVHPNLAQSESDSVPMRRHQLVDPAKTWALMDADQEHPRVSSTSWKSSTPEQPIHGGVRHALFFDGHVEAVDVGAELP